MIELGNIDALVDYGKSRIEHRIISKIVQVNKMYLNEEVECILNNQVKYSSHSRALKIYVGLIGFCMSGFWGFDKYLPFHALIYVVTYIHIAIFTINAIVLFLLLLKKGKIKIYYFKNICVLWLFVVFLEIVQTYIRYRQPIIYTLIEALFLINPLMSVLCFCQLNATYSDEEIICDTLVYISAITSFISVFAFFLYQKYSIDILLLGANAMFRNGTVRIITGEMLVYPMIMISLSRLVEKKYKVIDLFNIVFGLTSVFFVAQTRAVIIGIILTFLLYISVKKNLNRYLRLFIVTVILIILILFALSYSGILSRITSYLNSDWGILKRYDAIKFYINEFLQYPILGMGLLGGSKNLPFSELLFGPYGVYYRGDVGLIGFINAYGIIGFIWLMMLFKNLIQTGLKYKNNGYLLIITFYCAFTMISLDFMNSNRSMYLFVLLVLFYFAQRNQSLQGN